MTLSKMDEVTRQLFSIQEKKVSTLIVAFLFFCGLGVYLALSGEPRDLPPNLVTVIIALITAIAGVNAVDSWAQRSAKNEDHRNDPPI